MMDLCAICLERFNDPYGCTLDLLGSTCPTQQKWYRKHLLECAELEIQGTDAQASAPKYVPPNAHSAGPSAKLKNNAQIPTMKSRSTAAPGCWCGWEHQDATVIDLLELIQEMSASQAMSGWQRIAVVERGTKHGQLRYHQHAHWSAPHQ